MFVMLYETYDPILPFSGESFKWRVWWFRSISRSIGPWDDFTKEMNDSGVRISSVFAFRTISPSWIPDFIAMLPESGDKPTPSVSTIPLLRACSKVGTRRLSTFVENFVFIPSGETPTKNNPVRMIQANRKFIATPASITALFAKYDLETKESLSVERSSPSDSPFNLTNPPIGSQLSVYSVPDRSWKNLFARGGIPIQNSSTFIFASLATKKCPSS